MKTIEEKAKAYDEAIERVKRLVASKEIDVSDMEFIFPELAESEDERIRKKLIGIFTNQSLCDVYNLKSEEVIAYLEKQKPNPYILCESIKDKIKTYIANHFITDEVVKTDVASIVHAMEEGVRFGMAEQNPAEWSEEDEYIINNIFGFVKENTSNPHRKLCAEECLSWLNNRLKSLRPQSKQEWSEEEKACLNEAIETLNKLGYEGIADNLKHLHPELKQEWTEEDEKMMKKCLDIIEKSRDSRSGWPNNVQAFNWLKNKLKLIRPQSHWKPSKEQMEVLNRIVNAMERTHNICTSGYPDYIVMASLLSDLEKL